MGIEAGRLHFSWISSAEAGKFVDLVKEITDQVMQLGPATKMIKELPILLDDSVGTRDGAWSMGHGGD
jgi:hypothetical protein